MDEENKLTLNFWLGIFKIDTNLTVEEVSTKILNVTSHKTSFISLAKKEVHNNPENFMFSGNIKKNKIYIYNTSMLNLFPTIIRGTIKRANFNTRIHIYIRPNLFIVIISISLLLVFLKQLIISNFSSDYQETLYYMLGMIVFIYCFYLIDVKIHLQTLKKLFDIETH